MRHLSLMSSSVLKQFFGGMFFVRLRLICNYKEESVNSAILLMCV